MDKFWIEKAQNYLSTHSSFSDISDIHYSDDLKTAEVSAITNVNLPAIYLENGITDMGVRNAEPVRFVFPNNFPLNAPRILLRDDFPRGFPHINPNKKEVCPCIFEGSPSELLQQAEWMNAILNQLADWLEKAAANSLVNYDQGWEPMRNDDPAGFINYDLDDATKALETQDFATKSTFYELSNGIIFTDDLCGSRTDAKTAISICCIPSNRAPIDQYIPNPVTNLSELYSYANQTGITGLKEKIEQVDMDHIDHQIIFVVLAVPRPCKLIGSNSKWEFINFVIHKAPPRKGKKRVLPNSPVKMLSHIAPKSPALFRKLSGSKHLLDSARNISLVGCGSLGSKIGLHLMRNGNSPFQFIDNDIFLPHNNARHGLSFTWADNKAKLMEFAAWSINGDRVKAGEKNALQADYSESRLIIDSTASFSVRSFLMACEKLPPIISTALYDQGKAGVLLIESKTQKTKLSDLWAHLYRMCIDNNSIREMLFSSAQDQVSIGQSCSSNTLIMSDSTISLYAASFSLRIQDSLEVGLPKNGEILIMKKSELGTLLAEKHDIPHSLIVQSLLPKNWKTRLSIDVEARMRELSTRKQPNETGGVLLGTVFLNAKTIVITDILDAPPDSIESPTKFILGTDGLENKIKTVEKRTHGKVTYLGTWHSHPFGGSASATDKQTAVKLLFVRNHEPTVCLIWTPNNVLEV